MVVALCWLLPTVVGQPSSVGSGDIVILYENDVHGAIEGYPLMSAVRDQMRAITPHVAVVSCGDYLSGTPLGSVSRGRYLVRMMNAVGYDFVTLGNHEFDFGVDTLRQRMKELTAAVLCANFSHITDSQSIYACSAMQQFGSVRVGYVGVTTPQAATTSTPLFFQDTAGRWIYTFYPQMLDSVVQQCVDEVRRQGADYVVLLSHLGDNDLPPLVAATTGIDVVLDGHTHSVIPHRQLANRLGGKVLWTSTGSNFKNIGRLVIKPHGEVSSELLPTAAMPSTLNDVSDTLRAIQQAFDSVANRRVGYSQAKMWRKEYTGNYYDAPLGNFFCDAFLALTRHEGAELALMNSGGMRADIAAGEMLFGDLYAAAPFDNKLCVVEMSGQVLLDALEMGCRTFPKTGGGFLQVSGVRYEIDTNQPSGVVCDDNGMFVGVKGARRVKNVAVYDSFLGRWVPLDPWRIYRVAGCDYTLMHQGDGHRFPGARVVDAAVCPYAEALERYLRDFCGGVVEASKYAHSQGRIRVR